MYECSIHAYMIITYYYAHAKWLLPSSQPAHTASTGALLNCQGPRGGVTVGENINLNIAILLGRQLN